MLTITALKNPAFLEKIGAAMREAVANSRAWRGDHGKAYVANRHGNNVLRVSYHRGAGFVFYGAESRNVTACVLAALRASVAAEEQRRAAAGLALVNLEG